MKPFGGADILQSSDGSVYGLWYEMSEKAIFH